MLSTVKPRRPTSRELQAPDLYTRWSRPCNTFQKISESKQGQQQLSHITFVSVPEDFERGVMYTRASTSDSHNTCDGCSTNRALREHCFQMQQTLPELWTPQRHLTCTSKFRQKQQNWIPSVSHQRQLQITKLQFAKVKEGRSDISCENRAHTQPPLPDTMAHHSICPQHNHLCKASFCAPTNDRRSRQQPLTSPPLAPFRKCRNQEVRCSDSVKLICLEQELGLPR